MIAAMPAVHVMAAERRVVKRLKTAGATNPHTAVPLADLRRMEGKRLRHLMNRDIVHKIEPDRARSHLRAPRGHGPRAGRFPALNEPRHPP
jgi:hypothetical protein